jgi:hypothetical protein
VGPTAAELESINELIQFDHIYYKPKQTVEQPKSKSMVSVLKPVKTNTTVSFSKPTVTTQIQRHRSLAPKPATSEAPLCLNLGETDIGKLSDTLEQVADFDKIFQQLTQGQECADNISVSKDIINTSCRKRKVEDLRTATSKKAKQEDDFTCIAKVPDTLTTPDPLECGFSPFDFDDSYKPLEISNCESGYGSDGSPYSPASDLSGNELQDNGNGWEESFTDLFPALTSI